MAHYSSLDTGAWGELISHMREKGFLNEPFVDGQNLLNEEGISYYKSISTYIGSITPCRLITKIDKDNDKLMRVRLVYEEEEK